MTLGRKLSLLTTQKNKYFYKAKDILIKWKENKMREKHLKQTKPYYFW